MKLISDAELASSIVKVFPKFEGAKFKYNRCGWTSVIVDIDDEYICKFPRTEQKLAFLKTENLIIEKFARAFPEITFPQRKFINSDIPFYIHKKLQGEFITVEKYNRLNTAEREIFADEVASFFARLHRLPVAEFQNLLPGKNEKLPNTDTLLSTLKTDFNAEEIKKILKIIDDFSNLDEWSSQVVGYYDFHAHNILFNPQNLKLCGIFDFDEVAIGTAKFDLREIFLNYNEEIGYKVVAAYNRKASHSVPPEVVKTSLVGWSFAEYMNMKQKIKTGELTDVSGISLAEFKTRILKMMETY